MVVEMVALSSSGRITGVYWRVMAAQVRCGFCDRRYRTRESSRRNDAQPSMAPGARLGLDDDVDVLVKCGQEPQQPIGGELSEAAAEQLRHLGLIDSEYGGGLGLCQSACLDERGDPLGQTGLEERLFRVGETQVGENVPAAGSDTT